MKKKFMMVTLLLGTLMLGACVDDNETASVSAVREATAKQLKSVAAMNRAEAEATKALADAEVALMQAKAAAEKANAELDKAKAEMKLKQAELIELKKESQSITNQEAQARLEEDLARLEKAQLEAQQSLAQIAADMQAAEINAQAAMLVAQKELLQAQQALLDSEADLAEAKTEAEREAILAQQKALKDLAQKYSTAVNDLLEAKSDYNRALNWLISLENDLVTAQQTQEQAIIDNNNTIAKLEAQIAAYKQYANYTEDLQALKNKKSELEIQQELLHDGYFAARMAFNSTTRDLTESSELTDSLKYKDKFSTFARRAYSHGNYSNGDESITVDDAIWRILNNNGGSSLQASEIRSTTKVYQFDAPELNWSASTGMGDSIYIQTFPIMPDFRGEAELAVEDAEATYKALIKSNQDAQERLEKWYNGAATEADYVDGGSATKSVRNLVDSTAYLKAKYEAETDETLKADYRTKYETVLDLETSTKSDIETAIANIEENQKNLDNLLDQWDMLKNYATYQEELQKAMDKRNEKQVEEYAEMVAAWYDMMEKDVAWQVVNYEIDAIDKVLNPDSWRGVEGAESIDSLISNLEDQIASLKAANEDYSTIESKEEAIAMQEDRVAAYEAVVKAREIAVAQTKADLDAALAKSEGAEE